MRNPYGLDIPTKDDDTIESAVGDLASRDSLLVQRARECLPAPGKSAVPRLLQALTGADDQVRWEAARALAEMHDPLAVPALVQALENDNFVVRWSASQALSATGRRGLAPLLQALVTHSDSAWLRQGAHHVLHDLARGKLKAILSPVLKALDGVEPALSVPVAAAQAMATLADEE